MLLTPNDFPLYSVGPLVYCRTRSSALFQAEDDAMAADLAFRLTRDEMRGWGPVKVFQRVEELETQSQ